ncbi:MAG TPA: hypothetical protein O0X50_03435 [Methanocorpusculum sp.]|nr:hypothetical protein [Methanocorpusculum sp.]
MPESDDIADMMDVSSVTAFLESLEKKHLCERVFAWKRIVAGANRAAFALEMIAGEYKEKVSAYRRTVGHFKDDVCTAYTACRTFMYDKQELVNLLAASERRERALRKELRRLRTKRSGRS